MMKRITIIDDDPWIQDAFSMVFDPTVYSVSIYGNPDTLYNNTGEKPDIIILDKQLSGVDGLDVCRYLKGNDNTKNIPVIMLSATPEITTLAKNAGADDAIEKPFKMNLLREIVAKYVG